MRKRLRAGQRLRRNSKYFGVSRKHDPSWSHMHLVTGNETLCIKPIKVADVGFVACRECWQCRERKIDDWVGRNIAESKTAKAGHVVTLTYGEDRSTGGIDHIRAAVLTYSDVQKMLKLLRIDGYPVRYFAIGEYGSKKGRAHWHIILYWHNRVPDHELRRNFGWKYWPHGWSYFDKMTPEAVRYACKYLVKDLGGQMFGPMPSKKPPLGDAFFRDLALRYVDAGLAPQELFYSFPDVRRVPYGTRSRTVGAFRDAAKPIRFMMRDKTADNFCRYFVEAWRDRYNDEPPQSAPIWAWLDKGLAGYLDSISIPQFELRGVIPKPTKPPLGGTGPFADEVFNTWYSDVEGQRLYWSYDTEGEIGWHEKIGHDPAKARRMALLQEQKQRAYLVATRGE